MSEVDFTRIQETSDGDMEFEFELIDMYLEDAKGHVDTLTGMLQAGEAEGLRQAAHTLKGSSANIGANLIMEVCTRIEAAASAQDLSRADALGAELEDAFSRTERVFKAYVAEHA